ncbi:NAD(P)/FAD-dependent oxidoreductase [Trinickia caryophylli]|nr:FAD/NAD(P)-binding oxidoreductase [Trinickia caryophylli]TRX15313.1 NAD(P)/FAD-dependent oxidoreductase [Trinickia caryophylli]
MKRCVEFDLVIVGAGPAGLAAAGVAASRAMRVAVIDDNPRPGGQVWRQGPAHTASEPLARALDELRQRANVTMFAGARIVAAAPPNGLLLEMGRGTGRDEASTVLYSRLIVATGARERLLPFSGWTLPGVTGAGGLQALIKGGVPVRGQRIAIAGSGPLLLAALATARAAGANVVAVIEQAPFAAVARFGAALARTPAKLWQAARLSRGFAGTRYLTGSVIAEACGRERLEAVVVERGARRETIACDRLAIGYGLVPNTTLAQALGCALTDGAIAIDGHGRTSVGNIFAAGECTGIGGVELACVEGRIAGIAASGEAIPATLGRERDRWRRFAVGLAQAFALGPRARAHPPGETLLCRCEDATFAAVAAHASWRDAKLHTRCGMGACQGRICGAAANVYFGWDVTAARPPIAPARIATLAAGDFSRPIIGASSTFERDH